MKRRYVKTGDDCSHCKESGSWSMWQCPIHPECGLCQKCAEEIDKLQLTDSKPLPNN